MKYILGGGISGLIAAFLNPEYQIITDKVGGFAATEYGSNTFVLHNTPETRFFLDLLQISYSEEDLKITYNDGYQVLKEPTQKIILEIIKRKLYDLKKKEQLFVNDFYEVNNQPYIHSQRKDKTKVLSVPIDFLLKRLIFEVEDRIICAKVTGIDKNMIHTNFGCSFEYDKIISTIPAPLFWKLYKPKFPRPILNSADITLLIAKKTPYIVSPESITYYLKEPFSRIICKNNLFFFEFTGNLTKKDLKELVPKIKPIKIEHQPFARLEDTFGNIAPNNITFLGRFAEWNKDANIGTHYQKNT